MTDYFAGLLDDGGTDQLSGGGGLNFGSTDSGLDLSGTTFGSALDDSSSSPVSSGGLLDSIGSLVNMGLGVYKTVQTSSQQTTGQPEKTPDGRYVANIQGTPTVLQPDSTAKTIQLLLVGAVVIGAVLLLRKA